MTQPFTVEQRGAAAIFCIQRPERANALNRPVLLGLGQFCRHMQADDSVRALIVTGAGDKAFCAGADLKERLGWSDDEVRTQLDLYRSELGALDQCSKPVIAAINGLALGGGLEIALACDLRVACEHALFAAPEVGLGIIPGAGGTQRLARTIGVARAKEMILLGRRIDAARALHWGLINDISPANAPVLEHTLRWIEPLLNGAGLAHAAALRAIDASAPSLEPGLQTEREAYEQVLQSEDRLEGLQAFRDKRPPRFRSR